MLDLAKDMLRHAVPSGDTGEIRRRALKALLDELARNESLGAADGGDHG